MVGVCSHALAEPVTALPAVVVTAQRTPESALATTSDVVVLERRDIEASSATNLIELLGTLPGIQSAAGSNGGDNNIYIRGSESRMTMLLIDGVRVDSQEGAIRIGGGAPWEMIPLEQIDRIEVLKGPASTVYGADAMGGVVQVFTRRAVEGGMGFVNAAMGSQGFKQGTVGAGLKSGPIDWFITAAGQFTNGYDPQPRTSHTPANLGGRDQSLSVNAGIDLTPQSRVEWTHMSQELHNQYLRWGGGNNYNSQKNLITDGLRLTTSLNSKFKLKLSASESLVKVLDDYPNQYDTKSTQVSAMLVYGSEWGDWLYNLDRRADAFDQLVNGNFDPNFRADRSILGQSMGWNFQSGLQAVTARLRSDRDSLFGTTPTASFAYALGGLQGWRASASLATSYRAPTLEQLYSNYGDVKLKPEKGRHQEASLRYVDKGNESKLTAYRNLYEDLISSNQFLTTCGAAMFCYYNVNRAEVKGLTFSQTYRLQRWQFAASMDALSAKDLSTGKQLNMRAPRAASLKTDYIISDWMWSATLRAVDKRYSYANEVNPLAGYSTVDLQVSKTFDGKTRAWFKLLNATDHPYDVVNDYRAPGRTWMLGLSHSY